ncbi:MAG: tyrosine--tRNA ligase [Candidatus Babeliaceae bacterium]|nr:tyrosine--tRNA ligase [Candidatus Babeliaceae bacterium]
MNVKEIVAQLVEGTVTTLPLREFEEKIASGKRLRVKLGMDPTAPDLHLGHAVVLSKMRQFQDLGHEVIFLIGDFTARIGDPTGRSKTRPPLTEEEIAHNTKTYFDQVSRILDPKKVTVKYNSEWLDRLTSRDWIKLCAKVTLARIIEREDFAKRLVESLPIGFHELLYPLLQGYDSVVLHADVELGGSDQTFNLLMGRHLQEQFGQEAQVVMTMPLLEGCDGVQKMSKSYGNTISFSDTPEDAFGKIMSISDTLMWRYYELVLQTPVADIERMKMAVASGKAHPMELKKELASKILSRFWGDGAAERARKLFEQLFQKRDFEAAQEVVFAVSETLKIIDLLKRLDAVSSSSEARRLISEGAVTINGEKVTDVYTSIVLTDGMRIKVGKRRFYRVSID